MAFGLRVWGCAAADGWQASDLLPPEEDQRHHDGGLSIAAFPPENRLVDVLDSRF